MLLLPAIVHPIAVGVTLTGVGTKGHNELSKGGTMLNQVAPSTAAKRSSPLNSRYPLSEPT